MRQYAAGSSVVWPITSDPCSNSPVMLGIGLRAKNTARSRLARGVGGSNRQSEASLVGVSGLAGHCRPWETSVRIGAARATAEACRRHPADRVRPASRPLPPPPPPPGLPGGPSKQIDSKTSNDPNALIGPAGYGTQGFIQATGTLPYTIDFENDGSAAAQDVTVTEQLDPNLDWSTFQLGSFGFGPVNVTIPAGLTQYQTTVSYQNTDGSSLNVQVVARLQRPDRPADRHLRLARPAHRPGPDGRLRRLPLPREREPRR